jgi:hypothetical protein
MDFALYLHNVIHDYNILETPTQVIKEYFANHPDLYKTVLVANHVFRAIAMHGFQALLPYSSLINTGICLVGSLLYRLTVETNCPYKFALPSFASAISYQYATPAIDELINGIAFASMSAFGSACLTLVPLAVCASYIILTVSYDVDHQKTCCRG